MSMKLRNLFTLSNILLLIILFAYTVSAQEKGIISGKIVSKKSGEPLIGVNVVLLNTRLGASSLTDGTFSITASAGTYNIQVSSIGYKIQTFENVAVYPGQTTELNISMVETALTLPSVVVTANKRTQSFTELPISVSVIDRSVIERHNVLTLNESFKYTSGISVVGGQVNIRNSGGYRMGTGSTVLLMIDGIPLLAGDTGDIKWDAIPINEIEKVEIVKGAGSALYGTSAMGGVINIITRSPAHKPQTEVKLTGGFYTKPYYPEWEWSDNRLTYSGVNFSHSRIAGKWQINASGGMLSSKGYMQNTEFDRKNLFLKMRYDFSSNMYLQLHNNFATDKHGIFIQWKDIGNALKTIERDIGNKTQSDKISVAASLHSIHSGNFAWTFKPYLYYTKFRNDVQDGIDISKAVKFGGDYQVDYKINGRNFVTTGIEGIGDIVNSDMFGEHAGYNFAFYFQDEAAISPGLKATLGFRVDYAKIDTLASENQFSPKLGLSWKINEFNQARFSIGKGFRYPLISEAFSNTTIAGFKILPNEKIRAESSWSYEFGFKKNISSFIIWDTALFWNEYTDMIEANPDAESNLRFENLVKARIRGFETSADVWLHKNIKLHMNYTYTYGEDLSFDEYEPLAYRPKQMLNINPELKYKMVLLGANYRFVSKMEKYKVFPGDKKVPLKLFDAWMEIDFDKLVISFKVDNFFQYYYAEIERNMHPTRKLTISLNVKM